MREKRKETSFSLPPSVHRLLKEMAVVHNRSMSREFEYAVRLDELVYMASPPTEEIIAQMVQERITNGMERST